MFCSNCGKQSEGANFCPYCGVGVHQEWQQPASAPGAARKRPKGRVWVIIGIGAGVIAIAAALFFILIPPAIEGEWYNEERGEVLVFNDDGMMQSIHMSSINNAVYKYDRLSGKGMVTLGTFSFQMKYADGILNITDMGEFTKAVGEFDADKFIDEYGDSVLGLWFDPKGEGVIDLHADGTYDMVTLGRSLTGKYTQKDNDISIMFKYITLDIDVAYKIDSGTLRSYGNYEDTSINNFVRDYKEQKGKEHFYDEAVGKWVSESMGLTFELFDNGMGVIYDTNTTYYCTYKYEPVGNMGYFSVDEGNEVLFVVIEDLLSMSEILFHKID